MTRKGFFTGSITTLLAFVGIHTTTGKGIQFKTAAEDEDITSELRPDNDELERINAKLNNDSDYCGRVLAMAVMAEAKKRFGVDNKGLLNNATDPMRKVSKKNYDSAAYKKHNIFCYEHINKNKYNRVYLSLYSVGTLS